MGLLKIAKKGADELLELADNLLNAKKAAEAATEGQGGSIV